MNTKSIAKAGLLISFLYFISVVLLILFSNNITILLMEIITMLSGIYMPFLIISIIENNDLKYNIYRLLAIIFVSLCMLLTNSIHWLNIIVIKPLINNGINIPEYLQIGTWPSFIMAIDYLGWGLFMGMAFIFSGINLKSSIGIKWILWLNGSLCLIGFFSVILNENLWYIAPLGYGIGTVIICIKLLMTKDENIQRNIMLFDEIYYRNDRNLLDFDNSNIILRNAVRAVIINENKILMAHLEKTDEYKFPGGGRNENETIEEALKREVLEEVGYNIIKVNEKIGTITEYAIAKEGRNNIFKMISEYYLVEIENKQLKQNLEEYEMELLFKPCWIEIKNAYKINLDKINRKYKTTPGINRETIALEKLNEKYRES